MLRSNAPDGGWGWVVCFACFIVHILTDGLFFSFGILFIELCDSFKASWRETTWIYSIFEGVTMLEGPLAAALINRFGCRWVAVGGALLLCGGYLISTLAPNVSFLYFSIGILAGGGNGLVCFSAVICVNEYFDKRRSLATGIGVSGSGIGTFVFLPVTSFLINTYKWRGALLILSGIVLNALACGLVFLPLNIGKDPKVEGESVNENDQDEREMFHMKTTGEDKLEKEDDVKIGQLELVPDGSTPTEADAFLGKKRGNREQKLNNDVMVKRGDNDGKSRTLKVLSGLIDTSIFRNIPFLLFVVSSFICSLGFYLLDIYPPTTASDVDIPRSKAAWLFLTIGICNTGSRIIFGFLADRKQINRLYLYIISLIVFGVATVFVSFLKTFELLLGYCVIYGTLSGITVSLRSVLLVDFVGIKRLPEAFGVCNLFIGITIFIRPRLEGFAGMLSDLTGSYHAIYGACGVTLVLGGAILFFALCSKSGS